MLLCPSSFSHATNKPKVTKYQPLGIQSVQPRLCDRRGSSWKCHHFSPFPRNSDLSKAFSLWWQILAVQPQQFPACTLNKWKHQSQTLSERNLLLPVPLDDQELGWGYGWDSCQGTELMGSPVTHTRIQSLGIIETNDFAYWFDSGLMFAHIQQTPFVVFENIYFLLFLFTCICFCVSECPVCTGQKRTSDLLKLELEVVVSWQLWVLGTTLRSSERAAKCS